MSLTGYEMKAKKLLETKEKKLMNLYIFLLIFALILFFLVGGFKNTLVVLLIFCTLIVLLFVAKNAVCKDFEAKMNENFDNEFLTSVAGNLGLLFQPFGGFFIEDFDDFSEFKGAANILESNKHFSGEFGTGSVKFGDAVLIRNYKKEKAYFGVYKFFSVASKILPAVNNADIVFNGFLGEFKGKNFDFEMIIKTKGNFAVTNLKMLKSVNDVFEIYSNDEQKAVLVFNKIASKLNILLENFICEISLYLKKDKILIAVENSEILKAESKNSREQKSKNAKFEQNLKIMMEIFNQM